VRVVSEALHVSEYVFGHEGKWTADNDDSSWHSVDGAKTYRCDSCDHEWPCDDEIEYEWVYS
jgi:hypothetical protein